MKWLRHILKSQSVLARQSFWVMLLKALGLFLGYVVAILISRNFGPVGLGFYSIAQTTMIVYGHMAGLGLPIAILRYAGQFSGPEDAGRKKTLYYKSLRLLGISVIPLSLLLIGASDFIATRVFNDPIHADTLRLVALAAPFFTLNLINVEYLRGLGQAVRSESYRTLLTPLCTVLGIIAFHQFEDLKLPVYALAGGVFLTAMASLVQTMQKVSALEKSAKGFPIKELLTTALPLMIVSLGAYMLANLSLYMVQALQTTYEVGIFALSLKLAVLISFVSLAVNTTIAPRISQLYWKGKQKELARFIQKSTKYIILLSMLPFLVLILLPETLLSSINPEFAKGSTVLVILCFSQLINSGCGPVGLLLQMSGHQNIHMQVILGSVIFVVAANFVLISFYGIVGAAIATLVGVGLKNLVLVILAKQKMGICALSIPRK